MSKSSSGRTVPDFFRDVVADEKPASPREVAEQAVLALNASMFTHYDRSLAKFMQNLRDRVPILLALFTGQGGNMILYRPGKPAEVAPSVPLVYQLAKSVGHSSMGIYEIVSPYLTNPQGNQLWLPPMRAYRAQHQTALESLDALDISKDDKTVLRSILETNIAFMDACIKAGTYTYEQVEKYCRDCAPWGMKTIGIATAAQVGHWMSVVEGWKKSLGKDWERTYAVSNSLYVARQNNILYTVLVQFMGTQAMGDRCLLIETPEFETTPEQMLDVLTRIVADRALGMTFFKDYFLMDVELLGGGGRKAVENEMKKRGLEAILPTLAPFRSTQWPWKTDPKQGTGPATLEEAFSGKAK